VISLNNVWTLHSKLHVARGGRALSAHLACAKLASPRCIVPASGYYEWRPAEGGKQPYFISAADGGMLSIAGLWDEWRNPESSESVLSATLIVTTANDFTRRIHDRMPVLLGHHDLDAWLTGKAGVELLRPAPNDLLRMGRAV
jgi:putative SOS response-associated peptidase YedK